MTRSTMRLLALAALAAAMLAGCGVDWHGTTWDSRRECEAFGGGYRADGTCHYGAP